MLTVRKCSTLWRNVIRCPIVLHSPEMLSNAQLYYTESTQLYFSLICSQISVQLFSTLQKCSQMFNCSPLPRNVLRCSVFSTPQKCSQMLSVLHSPEMFSNVQLFSTPQKCSQMLSVLHAPEIFKKMLIVLHCPDMFSTILRYVLNCSIKNI